MLKLHRSGASSANNPLNKLKGMLATNQSTLLDPSNSIVGTESATAAVFDELEKSHDTIANNLSHALDGIGNESADAMAQAIMVCSNTDSLAASMESHLGEQVGNESFASDSIVQNLHLTVGLAGELATSVSDAGFLFPKVIVDQATTNYKIHAVRTVIEPKFYHNKDGKVTDWGKLNLIDASVKEGMLRKELNILVPQLTPENKDLFVSEDYVTPWEVPGAGGEMVTTSFLGKGEEDLNLISISSTKGMDRNTEATILDRLDEGAKIKGLIVGIGDVLNKTAIFLDTFAANHSTFTRSETASDTNSRSVTFDKTTMMLNLENYTPPANGGFKAIDDIAELKALKDAGYTKIGFKVSNSYSLDLSSGSYSTTSSSPQIVYIEKEPGVNAIATAQTTDAGLLAAVAAIFLGSAFHGSLSNATLKILGDQLGSEGLEKLYPLNVHTPIEIRKDVLSKLSDADAIKMISQALILRRDDETVNDFHDWFNWAEANLGHIGVSPTARKDLDIIGLHYLAKPYVKRVPIDLLALLKEEDTTGKLDVLEIGLVSKMQDELLRMFQESNYRAVTRQYGSNPAFVPKVGLFGDSRIANYIMRTGEDRTFGDGVAMEKTAEFHPTDRESMRNVVYAMPRIDSAANEQDRTFGFGHSIEVTSIVVKRARDNGVAHDQVQIWPIYNNIVTMPTLLRFEIENLDEYLSKASADVVVSV